MDKLYTIEDLKNANLIVRNEYEDRISRLESQIKDLQVELSKVLSRVKEPVSVNVSNSTKESLTEEQVRYLINLRSSGNISDWARDFLDNVIKYKRISSLQKETIKKIVASSRN